MNSAFRIVPVVLPVGMGLSDQQPESDRGEASVPFGAGQSQGNLIFARPLIMAFGSAATLMGAPLTGPRERLPHRVIAPAERGNAGLALASAIFVGEANSADYLLLCPPGRAFADEMRISQAFHANRLALQNGQILRLRDPRAGPDDDRMPVAGEFVLCAPSVLIEAALRHAPQLIAPVGEACRAVTGDVDQLALCPAAWCSVPAGCICRDVLDLAENVADATLPDRSNETAAMNSLTVSAPEPLQNALQAPALPPSWPSVGREVIDSNRRFKVLRISVPIGAELPIQYHLHRDEHWVVVSGTAVMRLGTQNFTLYENQSVFVPLGTEHWLQNPGKVPLVIICVQTGSYLGSDDLFDSFGNPHRIVTNPARPHLM